MLQFLKDVVLFVVPRFYVECEMVKLDANGELADSKLASNYEKGDELIYSDGVVGLSSFTWLGLVWVFNQQVEVIPWEDLQKRS